MVKDSGLRPAPPQMFWGPASRCYDVTLLDRRLDRIHARQQVEGHTASLYWRWCNVMALRVAAIEAHVGMTQAAYNTWLAAVDCG